MTIYEASRICFNAGGWFAEKIETLWRFFDGVELEKRYYSKFIPRYNPYDVFPEMRKKVDCNAKGVTKQEVEDAERKSIELVFASYGIQIRRGQRVACPLHKGKNLSMSIAKHNCFHCFKCGEKGNTIVFVMKHEGLNFISAVRKINRI